MTSNDVTTLTKLQIIKNQNNFLQHTHLPDLIPEVRIEINSKVCIWLFLKSLRTLEVALLSRPDTPLLHVYFVESFENLWEALCWSYGIGSKVASDPFIQNSFTPLTNIPLWKEVISQCEPQPSCDEGSLSFTFGAPFNAVFTYSDTPEKRFEFMKRSPLGFMTSWGDMDYTSYFISPVHIQLIQNHFYFKVPSNGIYEDLSEWMQSLMESAYKMTQIKIAYLELSSKNETETRS